jgi:hypothetical protein
VLSALSQWSASISHQWGEEVPGGKLRLQLQLEVVDVGECCRILGSFFFFFVIVCRFLHLSSFFTEFRNGQRCSNCGRLFPFCQCFLREIPSSCLAPLCILLSSQKLAKVPPGVNHVCGNYSPFQTFAE